MKIFFQYISVVAFVVGGALAPVSAAETKYDIAIIGGRVIDPETGLDAIQNVGIKGGEIVTVTTDTLSAGKVIDAKGLVVAPGFIDLHAHGQTIPAARMQALDGVTTGLELEAGAMPISGFYDDIAKEGRPINYGASVNWASARIAALLDVEPDNSIEWFFSNFSNTEWQTKIATPAQLEKIDALVQEGIDEGGLGVGFLLGYAPGTGRKEYYQVSEIAAKAGVPTFTHARFLSVLEPESSFEGMGEIIQAAAGTGVHAHIVHMNSISLRDIGMIGEMVAEAQEQGLKVTTEAYPYGAGSTAIGAAMFRGPNWRERIGGMTAHNFDVGGHRTTEEEFEYLQREKPGTDSVIHFLDTEKPEDQAFLDQSILFPGGVIASDGGTWLIDGKMISSDTWPVPKEAWSHPRSAGTYSRFLRQYVREMKAVSLVEAMRRVSYGPAHILEDAVPQMKKKGRIQVGADADIVIFDLATVSDKATYETPAQPSVGFKYVIVGGVPVVSGGVLDTNVLPGKPVRNQPK
ncbi:amidohydrolase family protein [Kordiimonas pumila]|uniref:Amidohydrolase family protein n=1 Tax=Kordiimonas pumila TaxID=2161677 RepID=A0ABV7D369_9PROT|nr:amidohydrolase family protein [Kordiimonas pumila]